MMCVVYVVVLTVGLAVQVLAGEIMLPNNITIYILTTTAATDCSQNGAVRLDPELDTNMGPEAGYVQLCVTGQWSGVCGELRRVEASIICKQLGYSAYGTASTIIIPYSG